MSIVINLLLAIHVIVSLLIVLLVLMQRPKNEGLGAAFGGGMTENLFGAQTTNVLQTITRYLGGMFFILTLLLSWLYVKQTTHKSPIQQRLTAPTTVPAAPATPVPDEKLSAPAVVVPETMQAKPLELAPAPAPAESALTEPVQAPAAPEAASTPAATPAPATPKVATPKPAAKKSATPKVAK